jgi:hypothetical protein
MEEKISLADSIILSRTSAISSLLSCNASLQVDKIPGGVLRFIMRNGY